MDGFRWPVMAVAASIAALALVGTPARAQSVAPLLDCAEYAPALNLLVATWGYVNTDSTAVVVAPGSHNFFSPPPSIQGQPLIFQPGAFHDLFQTVLDLNSSSAQTWHVNGMTATATLDSPVCGVTLSSAPPQVTAPSVTGTPLVGQTLSGDRGVWGGAPGRVDLQWQRKAPGDGWQDIPGATHGTYVPV